MIEDVEVSSDLEREDISIFTEVSGTIQFLSVGILNLGTTDIWGLAVLCIVGPLPTGYHSQKPPS